MAAATARSGFRRMFSISAFAPAKQPTPPPKAEPSPNLFVSGLSKHTTTEELKEAFAKFGEVVHAQVVTDRVTSFSKGFGFVRYATVEDAAKGIEGMNGKVVESWRPSEVPCWSAAVGPEVQGEPRLGRVAV